MNMDCFLICRVSSSSQEDGFSLDAQEERLTTYAQRHTFNIIKSYKIVESSTRGKRKNFYMAIEEIKSYQKKKRWL